MTPENAARAAQSILDNRPGQNELRVLVDNPNDCRHSIAAFRKLGCKVKVKNDGALLLITRPTA